MEEPVRILHLHGGTSADVDLNLHPQITVVRGLHDPARQATMRQEAETMRPRLLWRSRVQEVSQLYQRTLREKV